MEGIAYALTPGDSPPTFGSIHRHDYHNHGVLMASGGQRPGMLLNTLQYTGRSLTQRIVWSKKPMVLLRNPALRQGGVGLGVLLQAHSESQGGRGAGGDR